MKKTLALVFSLTILSSFGQTLNDTIWYAANWQRTTYSKIKAIYGIKDYDENGQGMATYYWKDGTLHSHQNELNDLKHGLCTWYHKNGEISTTAHYVKDIIHGEMRTYNKDGELEEITQYDMGEFIEMEFEIDHNPPPPVEIEETEIGSLEEVVDFPDVEAEFCGGARAMQEWIATNVQYPLEAIENNEQGRVYLSFIVETDGSITNVVIHQGVSEALDTEAQRLVEKMPKWTSGELKHKKVRTQCRLPINFTLSNGNEDDDNKKKRRRR